MAKRASPSSAPFAGIEWNEAAVYKSMW